MAGPDWRGGRCRYPTARARPADFAAGDQRTHCRTLYVLLKPLRRLVTVYWPLASIETWSRFPLHSAEDSKLAIILSSVLTSLGVPSARCPCQMSSSPGDLRSVSKTLGGPPFPGPLFITTTF